MERTGSDEGSERRNLSGEVSHRAAFRDALSAKITSHTSCDDVSMSVCMVHRGLDRNQLTCHELEGLGLHRLIGVELRNGRHFDGLAE